jgi:Mitochondrial ribosomal protein subunit L20
MRRIERHLVPSIQRLCRHHNSRIILRPFQRTFQRWRSETTDPQDPEPVHVPKGFNRYTRTHGPQKTYVDETDAVCPHSPIPKAESPVRTRSFHVYLCTPEPPSVLPQPLQVDRRAPPAPPSEFSIPQDVIPYTQRRLPIVHKPQYRKKFSHLTQEDVDQIRELRFAGGTSAKELANKFGVTPQYVKFVAPIPEDSNRFAMTPSQEARNELRAARQEEVEQKKMAKLKRWVNDMKKEQRLKGNKI